MSGFALRWFAVLVLLVAAPLARSQTPSPLDLDRSFGTDGLVSVPQATGAMPGSLSLGFVQLPASGTYLLFSAQVFSGTPRIVCSRIQANGALDTSFGTNGSIAYALPIPDGVVGGAVDQIQTRAVVVVQGGAEIVHFVYKFSVNFVAVARFATDGSLLGFTSSNMPTHFAGGVGALRDVLALPNVRPGFNGLLMAVQGQGGEVDRAALIKYEGSQFFEGFSASFSNLDLRVFRIAMRPDGKIDALGTAAAKALYVPYDPAANVVGSQRFFDLHCSTSTASASVLDDIVRDAPLTNEPLLIGRARCTGGDLEVIAARVSSIDTAPTPSGHLRLSINPGACDTLTIQCATMAMASQGQSGRIYVGTPAFELAFVDIHPGTGAPQLAARYSMQVSNNSGSLLVWPTRSFGWYQGYPLLTGVGVSNNSVSFGMSRVIVGTLLSDGFEN
ncbi:hypothetical protein [Ahniella affigens]|nr:hypothetical protein [Ahniella affigens]